MGFTDLQEFLSPALELPVNGTTYSFNPSANLVLKLRLFYTNSEAPGGDDAALGLIGELMDADYDPATTIITGHPGGVWERMENAGVSGDQMLRVGQTIMLWFGMGHEIAERFWETGRFLIPNPPTPPTNRKGRRAAAKKTPKDSSGDRTDGTTPDQEP